MSYLAIQLIRIDYDDDHRGAEHATKRARIRAFPLAVATGPGVVHEVDVNAWRDYAVAETSRALSLPEGKLVLAEVLELEPADDGLRVTLRTRPERMHRCTIAPGTWQRLVWNHKDGTFDHKWLVERVASIGLFAAPPAPGVFLGEPAAVLDVRTDYNRNAYAPR